MRLLLDTHVFIWWVENNAMLGAKAKSSIAKAQEIYISHASGWEFMVKKLLGKLDLGVDFETAIDNEGFAKLPINYHHIKLVGRMKAIYGDPFDRMIIAQSVAEDLTLVTSDRNMLTYPAKLLNAKK